MGGAEVAAPALARPHNTNTKRKRTEKHKKPTAEVGSDVPAPPWHKVALCIYGTISRSIQRTWPHMETKLIGPLALVGFEVDIYGFGMELGSSHTQRTRPCVRPMSIESSTHAARAHERAVYSSQLIRRCASTHNTSERRRCAGTHDTSERFPLAMLFGSSTVKGASAFSYNLEWAVSTLRPLL
jgi:hypothetical protein